jgi:hypothetical protein
MPVLLVGMLPCSRRHPPKRECSSRNLNPANKYVLSSAEFDSFLAGRWKPREWKLRLTERAWTDITRYLTRKQKPPIGFEPGQIALIKEIRQIANEHSWSITVVQIPTREDYSTLEFERTWIEPKSSPKCWAPGSLMDGKHFAVSASNKLRTIGFRSMVIGIAEDRTNLPTLWLPSSKTSFRQARKPTRA